MPARKQPDSPLAGREVLVCVCGGIAAYKTAALVSTLVQRACGVTVAMTKNARRFVGPVTFEALSGRSVATTMWRRNADDGRMSSSVSSSASVASVASGASGAIQHLSLSENVDLIVVAPATANILGKLAGGIADDLVSSLLLGAACPVLLAPAMNTRMWQHPATRRNVAWLRENGFEFVGPEEGWQACRAVGEGRMSEPETILAAIEKRLKRQSRQ